LKYFFTLQNLLQNILGQQHSQGIIGR